MQNTSDNEFFPAFSTSNIPVACSCSNKYVPFLMVFLQSIIEHASPEYNYDVLVFECSISLENKKLLTRFFKDKNRSIRFINPATLLDIKHLYCYAHYAPECYFRLTAPLILKHYDKVIFTDIDLVFLKDPRELYRIPLVGKPIAACVDFVFGALLNCPESTFDEYCRNTLHLKDPFAYCNTGVLIINIAEFNKHNYAEQLLKNIKQKQYRILEQDALNEFFKTNICYLDPIWNVPTESLSSKRMNLFSYMPAQERVEYARCRENACVVHWAGGEKPWNNLQTDLADIWWKYARKTPVYELLLQTVILHNMQDIKRCYKHLFRYRFLARICWGKRKTHYLNKIKKIYNDLAFYRIDSIENV